MVKPVSGAAKRGRDGRRMNPRSLENLPNLRGELPAGAWKPGDAPHLIHGEHGRGLPAVRRSPEWPPAMAYAIDVLSRRVGAELRDERAELFPWAVDSVEAVAVQWLACVRAERVAADAEARGRPMGEHIDRCSRVGEKYARVLESRERMLRERVEARRAGFDLAAELAELADGDGGGGRGDRGGPCVRGDAGGGQARAAPPSRPGGGGAGAGGGGRCGGAAPRDRGRPAVAARPRRRAGRAGRAAAGRVAAAAARLVAGPGGAGPGPREGALAVASRLQLRRLRRHLGAFAAAVGAPLADWQAADLDSPATVTCLLWGRQLGKSHGLALRALHAAFRKPGARVLVVSGGGELGARRLLGEVRGLALGSELLRGSVADEGASLVRLSTGSEVLALPASEGAVRGWSADELLVDEAQLVGDELLLGAAFPTVSARAGARIVLAGTASVAAGGFFDLCRRGELGDPGVFFSRRVSRLVGGDVEASWLAPSVVEAAVSAMGRLRADAEYRCVWASGADVLFPRGVLDAATVELPLLPLAGLSGPARVLGGVDWGQTTDRSALVCLARLRGGRGFAVVCAERWEQGAPPLGVAEQIAGSGAHFEALTSETNGLGGPCSDRLFSLLAERPPESGGAVPGLVVLRERPRGGGRLSAAQLGERDERRAWERRRRAASPPSRGFATTRVRAHTSAAFWATGFGALRLLLERGLLWLPAAGSELRRELLLVRVELAGDGGERVTGAGGHLGDVAAALALASCPYRPPGAGGRWRHLLTELVDGPVPRPAGGGPVPVGGVAFQSARGPEVSVPGGEREAARPSMVAAGGGGGLEATTTTTV